MIINIFLFNFENYLELISFSQVVFFIFDQTLWCVCSVMIGLYMGI